MVISGVALSVCDGFVAALAARIIGGVGATIAILVATKMTTDWFDGREIVLAMSLLQVSWPFGAMLALPIQAFIGQSFGWPAVMMSGAIVAGAAFCAFAFVSEPSERAPQTAVERSKLPHSVLLAVIVAGTIWGAMNLACILFFSYAPLLLVAQGSSPTAAASLVSLAISLSRRSLWSVTAASSHGSHQNCSPRSARATSSMMARLNPSVPSRAPHGPSNRRAGASCPAP